MNPPMNSLPPSTPNLVYRLSYPERHLLDDLSQETFGVDCGGPAVCLMHQVFRRRTDRLEVLDDAPEEKEDREIINPNQFAGLLSAPTITPAFGMTVELAPAMDWEFMLCYNI